MESANTSSHSLHLVLRKANNDHEAIAKKIKNLLAFIEHESSQYDMLLEYQQEYRDKIHNQKAISVTDINRYRSFYAKLETALSQQKEKIDLAQSRLNELRQTLLIQQHKVDTLKDLIRKKENQIAINEEKKLQKTIDELSARRAMINDNT